MLFTRNLHVVFKKSGKIPRNLEKSQLWIGKMKIIFGDVLKIEDDYMSLRIIFISEKTH